MTVTGAIAVWRWDAIFPDRRDYMNMAHLPVATRTIFFANLLAGRRRQVGAVHGDAAGKDELLDAVLGSAIGFRDCFHHARRAGDSSYTSTKRTASNPRTSKGV